MNSNYDGSSVGQKNAEYGALDELYHWWQAATDSKVDSNLKRPGRLPKTAALFTVGALIMTVIVLSWALL